MAADERQLGRQVVASDHAMTIQLFSQGVRYVENDPVHVDRLSLLVALSEQGAHGVEHLTRTMHVAVDPIESCPYFVVFRWSPRQPQASRLGGHGDGGERLADFIGDGRRGSL